MLSLRSTNSDRDVLITGVGMVSPLGCSAQETWQKLLNGERAGRRLAVDEIDHFTELQKIAGLCIHGAPVDHAETQRCLRGATISNRIPPDLRAAVNFEPLLTMTLVALEEALQEAGLLHSIPQDRTAIVFGGSKGGLRTAERLSRELGSSSNSPRQTRDPELSEPDHSAMLWKNAFSTDSATRMIGIVTGAKATLTCPVAACATGLIAVLQGAAMVHAGSCDVCIVGSADAGLRASVLSAFHRLRVASRCPDSPSACRPFDKDRDGFLIGEGAGVMILESRRHAQERQVNGLARISGGGWLSDPTGMTQIDSSGSIVAEVLKRSGCIPENRPDAICLHGTGTESNDLAEARGVYRATQTDLQLCFGIKGAIGHLLGAAGSVETILSILSLKHQIVPRTANLTTQDERCPISLNSSAVSKSSIQRIAKLSLGFGGHVACGIFDSAR